MAAVIDIHEDGDKMDAITVVVRLDSLYLKARWAKRWKIDTVVSPFGTFNIVRRDWKEEFKQMMMILKELNQTLEKEVILCQKKKLFTSQ